ncbi:MAG: DUF4139 domain-containing protein [Bacteroidales bacterium]|jgi:uncharacterized protein (TIGR02231 family)|nr:DUF4139 domain-containing protein [Bacteroidales bacterium]
MMKNLAILMILTITGMADAYADNEKEVMAAIKHVTVYPDRAQVTHEASVELPSGKSLLRLGGLSPYIDAQSIQVKGTGSFVIISVNQQNNYLENLEDLPEVKTIRSQIEALQLKVEDEKTAVTVLQEKEAFLVANRAVPAKEGGFSAEQLKSFMDLYTNNMDQVKNTILKKTRLIKDYEKQIAALQKQIADKFGKQQLPSGEISVAVSCEKPVSGKMSFSYVVRNAGWYPSYDIRVDDISKPVTMYYKANVYQNTGVSWKDVRLSFSNATPWIAGDVPALDPWFIDYYRPEPNIMIRGYASGVRKSGEAVMQSPQAEDLSMEVREEAALPPPVEKQVGETTVTFDVTEPYSLASDGKVQTIEIQRTTTEADYKYVTVPKLSTLAYLTGNITDWAKQSLVSGEATLYFENAFVGKSFLNVNQLKDTLTVSLGTDNSILVKREKRQDYTSRRILGSNKTETYSFLITVRNNKSNTVKITVKDQIPVSTNSDIEVNAVELTGGRYNSQTGEVNWELEIKPQETRQLVLTYSVRYPKDRNIILE